MAWERVSWIFTATGQQPWMHSHAAVPIAEHVEGDVFRVYFSARDAANRSFTGALLVDITRPDRVLDVAADPVLSPGGLGEFDDSGAMATWLCRTDTETFLYYIGWNLGRTVPFRNAIGVARRLPDGSFQRMFPGPIVDRSRDEPHFCASCCVIPDGELWRMWYLSCTGWTPGTLGPRHHYHIKYAESRDGTAWRRDGTVAIDYLTDSEYAISRPSVVRDGDLWKMWFSHRGDAYRIGYAESDNGKSWRRDDARGGLMASGRGWDSDMVEYPFVFDHRGTRFMLYNGNGYGQTGFGLAVEKAR